MNFGMMEGCKMEDWNDVMLKRLKLEGPPLPSRSLRLSNQRKLQRVGWKDGMLDD